MTAFSKTPALLDPGARACGSRRRFVRLCLLAAGIVATAVIVSTAQAALGGRASAPVTLAAGEQITVSGSRLNCIVSTGSSAAHPTTIVCGEGNLLKPSPGTYAFAMADAAALVLKSSASSQPVLVAREAQPSSVSGVFPLAKHASSQSIRLGLGRVFVVGGTDVLCAVTEQGGGLAITCGLAARAGTFVVGSDVALIAKRSVVLSRFLGHNKFKTITDVAQPASPACKLCA